MENSPSPQLALSSRDSSNISSSTSPTNSSFISPPQSTDRSLQTTSEKISGEHIESVGGSLSVGQNTVRKCSFPSPISNSAPSTSALLSDDVEQNLQTFLEVTFLFLFYYAKFIRVI